MLRREMLMSFVMHVMKIRRLLENIKNISDIVNDLGTYWNHFQAKKKKV